MAFKQNPSSIATSECIGDENLLFLVKYSISDINVTTSVSNAVKFPQFHFVSNAMGSPSMGGSKRRLSSRGLGGALREQRARLYIIRRCVVMLLCWHD
ncbi:hypothetical protein JHK87_056909 [Glycine soja]|nr:hypothetical protein JHK87_056909 [Glycine soja]